MKVLVSCIIASLSVIPCLGQASSTDVFLENPQVAVKVSNAIGMPVTVLKANVFTDFGRGISKVSFDLKGFDNTTRAVHVFALIFSPTGEIKGGESWPIGSSSCSVTAKAAEPSAIAVSHHSQVLQHQLEPNAQLLLTVSKTVTDGTIYEVPLKEIPDPSASLTVRIRPPGELSSRPTGSPLTAPNLLCGPDFCPYCADTAVSVCGDRGVKSFFCSISTCTCSFTCCQSQSSC